MKLARTKISLFIWGENILAEEDVIYLVPYSL